MIKLISEDDGRTHINVYSKGKTELGKFLSNFTKTEIITLKDGNFQSVEGYWYWLGTSHPRKDELRKAYGWKAKELGRELKADDWQEDNPEFQEKIMYAIKYKIKNNLNMYEVLKKNKLLLVHYYVYGDKVVEVKNGTWILDWIASIGRGEV